MRTSFVAIFAAVAAASQAGTILGIDNNGIYKIDTATGASTLAVSVAGHGTGDTNGLAYNQATNTAYFQRNGNLWSVNLGNSVFTKTSYNVGDNASASFYNGAYYYGTSTQIKKVDFVAANPSVVATYNKGWSFGDIATAQDGKLYGVAGSSVFKIDLANNAYSSLSTSGKSLQLGFVGSQLYGIGTGNSGAATGSIYTVSTATGALTNTGVVAKFNGSALAIRDAATFQAVPEPGTMAALGLGALGLLRRRRAR